MPRNRSFSLVTSLYHCEGSLLLPFHSCQKRTSTGFPCLPSSSLAGHEQILGKVAKSYSTALPIAPQSSHLALKCTHCSVGLIAAGPWPLCWLAERARLINRDSSASLLIMQELLVSGGVPQQKPRCFCISNTATAGVMGFHADKAFWLFVILKRFLSAEW